MKNEIYLHKISQYVQCRSGYNPQGYKYLFQLVSLLQQLHKKEKKKKNLCTKNMVVYNILKKQNKKNDIMIQQQQLANKMGGKIAKHPLLNPITSPYQASSSSKIV